MAVFVIPGKPFAKQRPRSTRQGRVYTPKETVSFERTVAAIAAQHFKQPLTGAVRLTMRAVFEPPASWSGKKRREHMGRPHCQKPDLDNCLKAISDGLNRIAFGDDSQVAVVIGEKVWGETEQTEIKITEIGAPAPLLV
jgi:Holliday junction resolvase RusA-like endonuclease